MSNWFRTTQTFTTSSPFNGTTIGAGAATSANYEINTMGGGELDNSIYRISASKAVDNHRAATPSDEISDDEPMRDYLNSMTEEFEANMQLSDEASSSGASIDGYSRESPQAHKSRRKRRAPSPPVPHLRDLTVVNPFDPHRKAKKAEYNSTMRPDGSASVYVNRDQSPGPHKPAYKVVKGKAPQPPTMTSSTTLLPPPSNGTSRSSSLHRVVYDRSEKRPAPQPPIAYEQDSWRSGVPATSGAVEKRVKRHKRKNDALPHTISNENMSLTFREKMARFFGLTGSRKKKDRSRALSATFASRSSDIHYGPSRYGSTKTLQSFSFAHTKIYSPRPNNPEPVMSGGSDIDIVRPQANGVVKVQRAPQVPVLSGHEIRWSNRQSTFGPSVNTQAFPRRMDFTVSSDHALY